MYHWPKRQTKDGEQQMSPVPHNPVYQRCPKRRTEGSMAALVAPNPHTVSRHASGQDLIEQDPKPVLFKGMPPSHPQFQLQRDSVPTQGSQHDLQQHQARGDTQPAN